MDQETFVYGVIKDAPMGNRTQQAQSRMTNAAALAALYEDDSFPHLSRSMFAYPDDSLERGTYQTQIIHFAASYQAVEYHWEQWMAKFEALLKQMYWVSATVYLETELSGKHTFQWACNGAYHAPHDELSVQCEWEQELGFHTAMRAR